MRLIKSIEIRYLRSIHRLRLDTTGDLIIFSGANDVGKSNILKALNLFFNNQVDWKKPIDFYRDFSLRRLNEVRRESIKGKQFIRIDLEFERPSNYQGSLPPTFKVTKTWLRHSVIPQETNNLERQEQIGRLPSTLETARRMLSQFLNRVRFDYVPAIRDRTFFEYVLDNLQGTLATQMREDDPILDAVRDLNISLQERAGSLREDFKNATGIEANVSLPVEPNELFRAFTVSTNWHYGLAKTLAEVAPLSLSLRGDGIQARYVSSLLSYIAGNSSLFHIWGFEEPENSIEYNLAIELAKEFEQIYSKQTQIFVTSHSPAFMTLHSSKTISYRVYKDENTTKVTQIHPSGDEAVLHQLSDDIGLFRIQEKLYNQYLKRRDELLETQSEVTRLQKELTHSTMPVIYVEGKTDEMILNAAWNKLFTDQQMPYSIKNCDPLSASASGGAGGAGTLAKLLSTVQANSPHIAIGIFDQDAEGMKAYKRLPNYFTEVPQIEAKVSQNGKAAALLLPVPPGRNEYANYLNLYIEFYFSDEALLQQTPEGYGLVFRQPEIEMKVKINGGPIIGTEPSDLPHTRQIINGKTVFAEIIVPSLGTREFEPFRLIFEKIEAILAHIAA